MDDDLNVLAAKINQCFATAESARVEAGRLLCEAKKKFLINRGTPDALSWCQWCGSHIERSWSDIKKVMALARAENPAAAAEAERAKARETMRTSRANARAADAAKRGDPASDKPKAKSSEPREATTCEARGATTAKREAQTFEPRPPQEPVVNDRPDLAAELADVRQEVGRLRRYKDENPERQTLLGELVVETVEPTPDQISPETFTRMLKLLEGMFHQRVSIADVISRLRGWHRLAPGYQLGNLIRDLQKQITELKRENSRLRAQLRKRGADNTTKAA